MCDRSRWSVKQSIYCRQTRFYRGGYKARRETGDHWNVLGFQRGFPDGYRKAGEGCPEKLPFSCHMLGRFRGSGRRGDSGISGFCIAQLGVPEPRCALLLDICVSKKSQGGGIGRELMDGLLKRLKKREVRNLGLYSENVPGTLEFYEKQVFGRGRTVVRFDRKI